MFNILVVDDEKIVVTGIKKMLQRYNYPLNVYEAYDGKQACNILKNTVIDILLTDIEIPFINGLDLAKIAKECLPDIITVIFSAYSNFEYARKAISLNAVYYLLKPINTEEFRNIMDKVIERCTAQNSQEKYLFYATAEETLLFQDAFKNAIIDRNIIDDISFFNEGIEPDTNFSLCYLKFSNSVIKFGKQKMESVIKQNVKVSYCIFKIDDTQCVIAFRYFSSVEFGCHDLYVKITEWLQDEETKTNLFAICSERIDSPALICKEIEQIKHLEDMNFYFKNENIFLRTDSTVKTYLPSIDTQVFLDAIEQDVAEKNFISLQTNIEKLVEILHINRQLSPMYVKFIFFDIIKKIQSIVPEMQNAEFTSALENISNMTRIENLSEYLKPLMKILLDLSEAQSTHNHRIVESLLDYIHHNYSKDISLETLSEMVFLSPAYTSTIFKQVTDQTITNYINNYRMKKAKQLLAETNMKLVNIYPLVGYSSLTYFCTLFKNMFGETPSQYRKRKKEG